MPPQKVADRFVQDSADTNAAVTFVDYALSGLTVGHTLIIRCAVDNAGGGGAALGLTITNQSGTPIDTATDVTNTQNNDPGAASAGVTNNVIRARITATSGTVRVAHSSARHAGVAEEWKGISIVSDAVVVVGSPVGANGVASTNLASVTDSSVASGNLAYGAEAIEGPSSDTITEDADSTNGTWTSLTKAGLTNATATDNVTVTGGYKVVNATGGQTYNPTINNARDSAGLIIEFANGDVTVAMNSLNAAATVNNPGVANRQIVGMNVLDLAAGTPLTLARTSRLSAASATSFGTGPYTTGAFTPSDNSLLVVSCSYAADVFPDQPITIDDSAGLTWTSHPQQGNDNGASSNRTAQFTAPVGTGVSMTLELDAGTIDVYRWQVSAVDFTGYSTAAPTDATAAGSPPDGNPPASGLTLSSAPLSDSYVVAAVDCNTSAGTNVAPGAGWTEITEIGADFDVLEVQERTGSTSTSVVWATLDSVITLENSAVAVEIQAGTTGGIVVNSPSVTQGGPIVTLGSNDFAAVVNNHTITQTAGSQTVGMNSLNAAATVNNPTVARFDPSHITGLTRWWLGDLGITELGGGVLQWLDQSPTGDNFTQITATNRPLKVVDALGGKTVIRCDGNDNFMTASALGDASMTVIVVARRRSGGSTTRTLLSLSANNAVYNTAGDQNWMYSGGTSFPDATPDRFQILVTRYNSVSSLDLKSPLEEDSSNVNLNPNDAYSTESFMYLGSAHGGAADFGSFDVAQIIAYDSALSNGDIAKVVAYLVDYYSAWQVLALKGYLDDGDEDSSTAIGAPFTAASGMPSDGMWGDQARFHPFRLRAAIQAEGDAFSITPRLQYLLRGEETDWVDVTSSSEIRAYPSEFVTDGTATTDRMAEGTGTFVAGTVETSSGDAAAVSLPANGHTEVEWCLANFHDFQGSEVQFRVRDADTGQVTRGYTLAFDDVVVCENPYYWQLVFRGREDDGSETTATPKAAANTNWSQLPTVNFRVRFSVIVSQIHPDYRELFRLQYRHNGGTWTFVTPASSVVRSALSSNFTDEAVTTRQITPTSITSPFTATPTFLPGRIDEDGVASEDWTFDWSPEQVLSTANCTELEFCLQIVDADTATGDTIELRVTDYREPFLGYSAVPSITVAVTTVAMNGLDAAAVVNGPAVVQVVTLNSLDAAATVNNPTVTPGAVTVALNALDAAATVNNPTVTTSTTVTLNSFDASATLNDPTVVQVVTLNSLDAAAVVNNPTVTPGAVTVVLNSFDASAVVNNPTVTPGAVTVATNALDASATVNGPSVVYVVALGSLSVAAVVNEQTVTQTGGTQTVDMNAADFSAVVNGPTVVQVVTLNALDVAATVNNPTVTPGSVTVAMNALDAAATVNNPTVTTGAVTVVLNALDVSATVNGPSVVQVVALNALDVAATVNNPTVTTSTSVVLNSFDASAVVNNPTVTTGSVTVVLNALDVAAVVNNPTVTTLTTVTLNALNAAATVNDPSVVQIVALNALNVAATLNDPTVTPGSVTIVLNALDAAATVNNPTVTTGSVTVVLNALDASATVNGPTVVQVVVLNGLSVAATVNDPTVTTGAVTVAMNALDAAAVVNDPTVTVAGAGITMAPADFSAVVNNPSVTTSTTVVLNGLDASATVNNPTVTPGSVTVVLNALDASATVNNPTVTTGAVTVVLNALDASAVVNNPTVTPGTVTVVLNALDAVAVVNAPQATHVVTLNSLDAAATVNNPTVSTGSVTVVLNALDAAATVNNPTVTTDQVTVALNSLDASATVNNPTVTTGATTLNLNSLNAAATVNGPALTYIVAGASVDATATVNGPAVIQRVGTQLLDASATVFSPSIIASQLIGTVTLSAAATLGLHTVSLGAAPTGRIKTGIGTPLPTKIFNGSAWVEKPRKHFKDTAWVPV